jgi:hypothetical protein
VIASLVCLLGGGCGGATRKAPTARDVNTIGAAVSDIVYQCQSVAAGYVASADSAPLRRDVDALLGGYRRLRPDAPFVVGASTGVTLKTTLRSELSLAERNLQNAGCAPGQARRIAAAIGHH